MEVIDTPLLGCKVIKNTSFGDERGFFMESFNQQKFEQSGLNFQVCQMNLARSEKNVLRGLHYQKGSSAQAKLVGVISGSVLDVVVDIRPDSATFKKYFKFKLQNINDLIFVPRGCAHGYLSLEDDTTFYYLVDNQYDPKNEAGIRYNDPELSIDWSLTSDPIVSEKDQKQPLFNSI
jgi:dTDP-4-dehydrorhamnose 3,5-epimerase